MQFSRSIVLCGFLLCGLVATGSFAADLPSNVTLELPRDELPISDKPNDGWPSIVLLNGYGLNEVELSEVAALCASRGVAALIVDVPTWLGGDRRSSPTGADDYAVVAPALEFITRDPRLNAKRVVVGGFSQGAFQSLILGNRYPEKFVGILAISPRGGDVLPTMWGGSRAPQSLYLLAGSLESDATMKLVHAAASQWSEAGLQVKVQKHHGGHHLPENLQTELTMALDWLLMSGC